MKTVAYSSPIVPPEWIAAHGLRPWRLLPGENRGLGNRGLRRISSAKSVSVPDFPLDAAKSGTDTDTEDGIGLSPRFYSPRFSRQGVCPFLQAFMDDVCSTGILPVSFDAVILATTCDQMRRAGEMLSPPLAMPVFLMNVPVTWQSLTAAQMYQDELRRLGRFLVRIGGQTPSDAALTETMLAYQSARQDLLNRQEQMPARRFVELIFQLCQSNTAELCDADILSACDEGILPSCVAGVSPASSLSLAYSFSPFERQQDTHSNEIETAKETTARNGEDAGGTPATHADRMSASQRIPLAVVGGPMTARDLCVLDMIEQGGGRIVLNASESGQRCLPAAWGNRGQTPIPQTESVSVPNFPVPDFHDSPLATLAAAYFGAISDAFRRPDDLLYEYLRRELAARAVRGIVFVRQAWCDLWHAQAARMRAAFDLPLLDLDVSCPDSASANLSNRIQSFLEVLR